MTQSVIEKARDFAKGHFGEDSSGHDWWHVHRVWSTSIALAKSEGANRTIVEIGALYTMSLIGNYPKGVKKPG